MASVIRQNFDEKCESKINEIINMELYASYVYQAMHHFYNREDVALSGIAKFFCKSSKEEREHAQKFMAYQNKRGGTIHLASIQAPPKEAWNSVLKGLTTCLDLEKQLNQSLLDLHKWAESKHDAHLADFLESSYLKEQVESIKELSDLITQLKRAGHSGLGEYLFDKQLE